MGTSAEQMAFDFNELRRRHWSMVALCLLLVGGGGCANLSDPPPLDGEARRIRTMDPSYNPFPPVVPAPESRPPPWGGKAR